jgi:hypothetical protein
MDLMMSGVPKNIVFSISSKTVTLLARIQDPEMVQGQVFYGDGHGSGFLGRVGRLKFNTPSSPPSATHLGISTHL